MHATSKTRTSQGPAGRASLFRRELSPDVCDQIAIAIRTERAYQHVPLLRRGKPEDSEDLWMWPLLRRGKPEDSEDFKQRLEGHTLNNPCVMWPLLRRGKPEDSEDFNKRLEDKSCCKQLHAQAL